MHKRYLEKCQIALQKKINMLQINISTDSSFIDNFENVKKCMKNLETNIEKYHGTNKDQLKLNFKQMMDKYESSIKSISD